MVTRHTAKVLLIVPAARRAATRAWVAANIDSAGGGVWFAARLSATGLAPATHYAACFHATVPELKLWIGRLLTLTTGVSDPRGDWDRWSRAERQTWLAGLRTALRQQQGFFIRFAWNDLGEIPDVLAEYAVGGVTPVRGTLP